MKKYFAISILLLFFILKSSAQTTRGVKIGYIDMEYILENVPDYTEAKNQLEQKAQKWKQDIETKKVEIAKLKDALKTEKALLTKELVNEREEEIKFQETDLLDFQQKRFGPNGDLITQKAVLVKPIQDQVFTAVQDIAEAKKYDYIFDKSSDLTMLFADKRHNVSDQVIRTITRTEKREQLTKKQLKEQEAKEILEDAEDVNPALTARKKLLEDRKAARDKLLEDRKLAIEAKKKELDDKRKAAAEARDGKKTGANPDVQKTTGEQTTPTEGTKTAESTSAEKLREEKIAARAKLIEDNKKAQETKRKADAEAREAKKTGTITAEQKKEVEKATSTNETKTTKPASEVKTTEPTSQTKTADQASAEKIRAEKAAARAKLIEDKKKVLEERKKKILEDREAAKKAREEKASQPKTEVPKTEEPKTE